MNSAAKASKEKWETLTKKLVFRNIEPPDFRALEAEIGRAAKKTEEYLFLSGPAARNASHTELVEQLKSLDESLQSIRYETLCTAVTSHPGTLFDFKKSTIEHAAKNSTHYWWNEALIKNIRKLTFDLRYRRLNDGVQILNFLVSKRNALYQIHALDLIFKKDELLACQSVSEIRRKFGSRVKRLDYGPFYLVFSRLKTQMRSLLTVGVKEDLSVRRIHRGQVAKLAHGLGLEFCARNAADACLKNLRRNAKLEPFIKDCLVAHGYLATKGHLNHFVKHPVLLGRRNPQALLFGGFIGKFIESKLYRIENHPRLDAFDPVAEGIAILRKMGVSNRAANLLLKQGSGATAYVLRKFSAETLEPYGLLWEANRREAILQSNPKDTSVDYSNYDYNTSWALNVIAEALPEVKEYPLVMWKGIIGLAHNSHSTITSGAFKHICSQNFKRVLALIASKAISDKKAKRLKSEPCWEKGGFTELMDYLRVSHYLTAVDGPENRPINLPKNITLETLWANAREWHEMIQKIKKEDLEAILSQEWSTPVSPEQLPEGKAEINVIRDARTLYEEGQEMHHCVFSYLDICKSGHTIVVSIKDKQKKKERSTLAIQSNNGHFTIRQHQSYCNASPPEQHEQIAREICRNLNAQNTRGEATTHER